MPQNLGEKENSKIITSLLSFDNLIVICDRHDKEKATLYCTVCLIPVCPRCKYETHKDHSFIDLKKPQFKNYTANVQKLFDNNSSENILYKLDRQSSNSCSLKASEFQMLLEKVSRVLGNVVSDEECKQIDLAFFLTGVESKSHNQQRCNWSNIVEEIKKQNNIVIQETKQLIYESQAQSRQEQNNNLKAFENNQSKINSQVNDSIRTIQDKMERNLEELLLDPKTCFSEKFAKIDKDIEISNKKTTNLQQQFKIFNYNYSQKLEVLNKKFEETKTNLVFINAVKQDVDNLDNQFVKVRDKVDIIKVLLDLQRVMIEANHDAQLSNSRNQMILDKKDYWQRIRHP
eukprot:403366555